MSAFLRRLCALFLTGCLLCPTLLACGGGSGASTHAVTTETLPEVTLPEPSAPDKRIAFTFDDGPHSTVTDKILDELEALGGKATFFVVGTRLLESGASDTLRRMHEMGCEIGIHAFSHTANYDECDEETYQFELRRTKELIEQAVPEAPVTLMRPVGGRITEERVKACPYAVICWNVDPIDWRLKGKETPQEQEENVAAITDSIVQAAKDGGIVLMHDMYDNSYEAFCRAARLLQAEGYELVTVSELLQNPAAGKLYRQRD